ncbi:MAG: 2-oxo acid dehydrogenase subunit E2, partial [Alphaproteobacteria bacterium]|nr:2-oxo acid dehydrogenase subunit E2 [Alphaproteobacteria bacterium]
MPTQILMPALSPTMTEGNLAKWVKKEGDMVKAGQVIAEIETDKATMEVEAVDEGKLVKILISAGSQGVKVNTPIALLVQEGESEITLDTAFTLPTKTPAVAATPSAPVSAPPAKPAPANQIMSHISPSDRIVASPLAKRIAAQSGIDLKNIRGTGPNGRIIRADVEQASPSATPAKGAVSFAPSAQGIDAKDYADKLGMAYDVLPNSSVRKVIAKRLTESKQLVPHFYLSVDCEIDALLELRKQLNEVAGTKISVNDFVIRATALALKKIPAANVSWTDAAILQYKDVDVSVAVATPEGIVTPIIKYADGKSLVEIAAEMKDLGLRAREG